MKTLNKKVQQYKVLLDEKERLANETKDNNKQIAALEQEITQMMVDQEQPDITVDGYKYTLQEKTIYSKLGEDQLAYKGLDFLGALRSQGLGDLIVERVDSRTLSAAINNIVEEQGAIPQELLECLNIYSQLKLVKRKANMAALERARRAADGNNIVTR